MDLATTNAGTRSAYKTGFFAGIGIASRVDVMRWDALFHYAEFRDSHVGRKFTPHASAVKQGFLEGFAAGQNRKRLSLRPQRHLTSICKKGEVL